MNRDCYVDLQDFVLFAEDWLLCYDPDDSECEDYSDILSRKEMVRAEQWITEKFTASQPEPLFSFNYDGVSSADFLSSWSFVSSSSLLDEHRTKYIHTYTDPATGLEVRCEAVAYDDFPTVEWTVYFQNTSSVDAPILENIQTINTIFGSSSGGEYLLHRNRGDFCAASSYQPLQEYLNKNVTKAIANAGGRPTNYEFPYFNVENNGQGLIYVLSWAGQWTASFRRNDDNSLRITGGQELTHFKLLPGEQVRSPLVVVQFYMGDWIRAQNIWRRWMVAHNLPRRNGQMIQPFSSLCSGLHFEGLMTNAAGEKEFIDRSLDENIQVDYWWQDAGWYPCDGVGWPKTGTWEPDPVRFPNGLREVSDYAHARNIGPLVWFEPERIHSDTWLSINHPEWIYGGSGGGLLKLGDPACRQWLIDHFDNLITSEAIDFYRQDFNIDPLGYWRGNDAADRQGITEIKHIEGYFAFWDELISRHPGLWIDSCSSGGRRNDLETLRRAVPLLRSDYYADPVGQQGHTYGISMWFPFYGTGFDSYDLYLLRSIYSPEFEIASDMRNMSLNYDVMRQGFNEWKQISNYLLGDYYPLTPYSISSSSWIAWQFDQPDVGEGVVQAFRRSNAGNAEMTFKLKGLDVHAFYAVTNFDVPGEQIRSGGQLMFEGLTIAIDEQPGSAVITYKIR
jgi:alpha-galactosidase